MTHIILVRHGQTAWNEGEGERLRGRADLDLSEIEKKQAQSAATIVARRKSPTSCHLFKPTAASNEHCS